MKGYCDGCKKQVQGKRPAVKLLLMIICGIVPYFLFRAFFTKSNRCPICGIKIGSGESE